MSYNFALTKNAIYVLLSIDGQYELPRRAGHSWASGSLPVHQLDAPTSLGSTLAHHLGTVGMSKKIVGGHGLMGGLGTFPLAEKPRNIPRESRTSVDQRVRTYQRKYFDLIKGLHCWREAWTIPRKPNHWQVRTHSSVSGVPGVTKGQASDNLYSPLNKSVGGQEI